MLIRSKFNKKHRLQGIDALKDGYYECSTSISKYFIDDISAKYSSISIDEK